MKGVTRTSNDRTASKEEFSDDGLRTPVILNSEIIWEFMIAEGYKQKKAGPNLALPLFSDHLILSFSELIRIRDKNELCVGFALGVPLPEVIKEREGKQWVTDVTRPVTVSIKADREKLF